MSKDDGYILLWRKVRLNYLWDERREFSKFEAWIDMLLTANYYDREIMFNGEKLLIKRGELLTSQHSLAKRWNWSRARVARFLNALKKSGQVTIQVTNQKASKITVCNYESYQDGRTSSRTSNRTSSVTHYKEIKNNNKLLTAARSLITGSYTDKELYPIINKFKKLFGEDQLLKIIGGCISRGNEFTTPGNLAAYLQAIKNKNGSENGVPKSVQELPYLT